MGSVTDLLGQGLESIRDAVKTLWQTFTSVAPKPIQICLFMLILILFMGTLLTFTFGITNRCNSQDQIYNIGDNLKEYYIASSIGTANEAQLGATTWYDWFLGQFPLFGLWGDVLDQTGSLINVTDVLNASENDDLILTIYGNTETNAIKEDCHRTDEEGNNLCKSIIGLGCRDGEIKILVRDRLDIFDIRLWLILMILITFGFYMYDKGYYTQ